MQYAECLKKYYNAVDGTFYDAIKIIMYYNALQAFTRISHEELKSILFKQILIGNRKKLPAHENHENSKHQNTNLK